MLVVMETLAEPEREKKGRVDLAFSKRAKEWLHSYYVTRRGNTRTYSAWLESWKVEAFLPHTFLLLARGVCKSRVSCVGEISLLVVFNFSSFFPLRSFVSIITFFIFSIFLLMSVFTLSRDVFELLRVRTAAGFNDGNLAGKIELLVSFFTSFELPVDTFGDEVPRLEQSRCSWSCASVCQKPLGVRLKRKLILEKRRRSWVAIVLTTFANFLLMVWLTCVYCAFYFHRMFDVMKS